MAQAQQQVGPPREQPQQVQKPQQGRRPRSKLPPGMEGNSLASTEEIAQYLNAGRAQLFTRARELDALADDLHAAAAVLKRRLQQAEKAKQAGGLRERYQSRSYVARTMRPLRRASRAAGASASSAVSAARQMRRFWIAWQAAMEELVPRTRRERR